MKTKNKALNENGKKLDQRKGKKTKVSGWQK